MNRFLIFLLLLAVPVNAAATSLKADEVIARDGVTISGDRRTAWPAAGSALPVADTTSIAKGSADATKEIRIEVDGITAGTTRVLTMPDQDIDLAPNSGAFPAAAHAARHTDGSDDIQNATGAQKGLATAAQITKLDGIETGAEVTDAANVAAAGAVMDSDISAAEGFLRKTGAGAYEGIKSNLAASTDPGAADDSAAGYAVGSVWINTAADKVFQAVDVTAAAAVWKDISAGSGGGISSVVEDTTPQLGGDLDAQGFNIDNGGVVFLNEQAAADADVAGSGQVWVKTAAPNELWFTDDAGTDVQLGAGGGGGNLTSKTVTSASDISLASATTGGGGGSAITGASWASAAIPAKGVIRVTWIEGEMDDASSQGQFTVGIKVNGTVYWPEYDDSAGSNLFAPGKSVSTGSSALVGSGFYFGEQMIFQWDIAADSISTGSQTIDIWMGDNVNGKSGNITVTGTTVTTRFLIEIIEDAT